MRHKVAIIDDEPKIVEVLESYLAKDGFEIFKAFNGKDGLNIFYSLSPDLIILDLMLPDISGESICREIRKISNIPIIMLTAKSSEDNIISGISLGADDYIAKPFSPREVLARVKALIRRSQNSFIEKLSFNNGKFEINFTAKTVTVESKEINLTAGEFKLLEVLARRPKKVFTRDELLTAAFGNSSDIFERTIDAHIKNLRSKLEKDKKNPEYILTVFGIGYKFGGE